MPFSIELFHDDGSLQYLPETAFADCFSANGDSVQDDYLFQFGDVSEGLLLLLRHHTPSAHGDDRSQISSGPRDPRGIECLSRGDGYVVIATPEELEHIQEVRYNGKTVLMRMGPDLVNLMSIDRLSRLYFNEQAVDGLYRTIAELYRIIREEKGRMLEEPGAEQLAEGDLDALIARQIGVTRATLQIAIEYDMRAQLDFDIEDETEGVEQDLGTADEHRRVIKKVRQQSAGIVV